MFKTVTNIINILFVCFINYSLIMFLSGKDALERLDLDYPLVYTYSLIAGIVITDIIAIYLLIVSRKIPRERFLVMLAVELIVLFITGLVYTWPASHLLQNM